MSKLMQKSETKEELLINTIKHFNSENRCLNEFGTCVYRNERGEGCAIGREINDSLAYSIDSGVLVEVQNDGVFEVMPKRLQKMGKDFLNDMQKLHDDEDFWDSGGLSKHGENRVKDIIKSYELDIDLSVLN